MKRLLILLFIPLLAFARQGERNETTPRIVRLKLATLIPGQPDYGMKEVEVKLNHFLKDFNLTLAQFLKLRRQDPANAQVQAVLSSVNFSRFLSKRNIQVVRDPLGRFQIFDGHHLSMSLMLLEIENVDVELHEDFWVPDTTRSRRTLPARIEKFRAYMIEHKLVRLVNRLGQNIAFDDLPLSREEMKNNPFRSLTWLMKKIGVYEDLDRPMQEFAWADMFRREFRRRGWDLRFQSNAEFLTAVKRAITILSSMEDNELENLPGYIPIPSKIKKLREFIQKAQNRCERLLYEFET